MAGTKKLIGSIEERIDELEKTCERSAAILKHGMHEAFSQYMKDSATKVVLPYSDDLVSSIYLTDSIEYVPEEYEEVWSALAIGISEFSCKHKGINDTNPGFAYIGLQNVYETPNLFSQEWDRVRSMQVDENMVGVGTDWFNFLVGYCNKNGYLEYLKQIKHEIQGKKVVSFQEIKEIEEVVN